MGEHPNVTIAAIRGGAPWRLSRNPHACSLYLDIRTVPGQTVERVKRELRRVLRGFAERTGTPEPALHVYVSDPPTVVDETLPIIQALGAAQAAVTGERPAPIIRRPGADAVHLTAYGVPCVPSAPAGACIRTRAAPPCMRSASTCWSTIASRPRKSISPRPSTCAAARRR